MMRAVFILTGVLCLLPAIARGQVFGINETGGYVQTVGAEDIGFHDSNNTHRYVWRILGNATQDRNVNIDLLDAETTLNLFGSSITLRKTNYVAVVPPTVSDNGHQIEESQSGLTSTES